MSNDTSEPNDKGKIHRLVPTTAGILDIPQDQKGKPLREFFLNDFMPHDLENALVYQTKNGPVLLSEKPEKWNRTHEYIARKMAVTLKQSIDHGGPHHKIMNNLAHSLANQSDQSPSQTRAAITFQFLKQFGSEPETYKRQQRYKAHRNRGQRKMPSQSWE